MLAIGNYFPYGGSTSLCETTPTHGSTSTHGDSHGNTPRLGAVRLAHSTGKYQFMCKDLYTRLNQHTCVAYMMHARLRSSAA